MRITHVLDNFGGGGKERRCMRLIQGLNRHNIKDIQIIIIDNGNAYEELFECECKIKIVDRKTRNLGTLTIAKELQQEIQSFAPDIIQSWGLMSSFFVCLIRPFIKGKFIASYVADVIKPKFPQLHWFTNNICKYLCAAIVGNSKAGLVAYDIPAKKGKLIYNGFNEELFLKKCSIESKRIELQIETQYAVVMAASFSDYKDFDCYIDAAKIVCKQRKDITFLAVGSGKNWERINNTISEGERQFIKMLGRRNDIDEIFKICNLSVLTTNTKINEGLSNTIVESMAFGIPVLATNGGGTPEIISDKKNGFLIREQTPQKVAEQIIEIINDTQSLLTISEEAIKTIKERFLLNKMTDDFIDLYKSVLLTNKR